MFFFTFLTNSVEVYWRPKDMRGIGNRQVSDSLQKYQSSCDIATSGRDKVTIVSVGHCLCSLAPTVPSSATMLVFRCKFSLFVQKVWKRLTNKSNPLTTHSTQGVKLFNSFRSVLAVVGKAISPLCTFCLSKRMLCFFVSISERNHLCLGFELHWCDVIACVSHGDFLSTSTCWY